MNKTNILFFFTSFIAPCLYSLRRKIKDEKEVSREKKKRISSYPISNAGLFFVFI